MSTSVNYPSGGVIVTILPEHALENTIISAMPLDVLARVFARALSNWESPPPYLLSISDNLALLIGRQVAGFVPTPPQLLVPEALTTD